MATALIGILFVLTLCGIALRADWRLRGEDRLPMQWLLPDQVIWSAPRRIALAFVPTLALVLFGALTLLSFITRPRLGQEYLVVPSLIAVGLLLIGVQRFHLWMVERTLRQAHGERID